MEKVEDSPKTKLTNLVPPEPHKVSYMVILKQIGDNFGLLKNELSIATSFTLNEHPEKS